MKIDTNKLLSVDLEITDFDPKEGTHYGSTVIVIEGKNFSNEVTVSINGNECRVFEISLNAISCFTPENTANKHANATFKVSVT